MQRPPRILILQLAARAGVDPRTALKALVEGPDSIRGMPGERCAEAMRTLLIGATRPTSDRGAA